MEILVFLGSVRTTTPPRPPRLGERVAKAVTAAMPENGLVPTLIDPLALGIDRAAPFKPHFSYAAERAPDALDQLAARISAADGFVMVSPEYNHSMSPALADLLNHFGASRFGFKPSAIVTYSAGQWGGTRAAVSMRTFLSELGCLPVSAMIHVPHAADALDEDGTVKDPAQAERWNGYLGRTLSQLHWWAEAARRARRDNALGQTAAFTTAPSERNAPGG